MRTVPLRALALRMRSLGAALRTTALGAALRTTALGAAVRRVPRRVFVVAALVVLVAGVGGVALARTASPTPAGPATTRVQRGPVSLVVAAAGTVQSVQTRGLSFSLAGTVTQLTVKPGDQVSAGQVLASIDPADAQSAVDAATARLSDAQDAVDRARAAAALPACPTTTARAPAPAPTPAPTPTPTAPKPDPTPTVHAAATGAGGRDSPAAQPCRSAARAGADPLLQAEQQLNNAQLALDQARARLAGTTITAPLAGRVLSVGGTVGSHASPGGTGFIVLGDVSTMTVRAQVSEADVGRLAIGQPADITLPDRADPLPGTVSAIDPAGTLSNRLVRYGVVIAFDRPPADLLLGQSATTVVTVAAVDDALRLSSAAVTGVDGTTGTVVVRAGGHDAARTVTIGLRGDQYTQIVGGLAEGDEVVLPTGP